MQRRVCFTCPSGRLGKGNIRQEPEAPELVTNSGVVNDPALIGREPRELWKFSPRRIERTSAMASAVRGVGRFTAINHTARRTDKRALRRKGCRHKRIK